MTDTIIGGAIAAVLGAAGYAIIGIWQEHRREKARRLAIVDALIADIVENLSKCMSPATRQMWWLAPYKLEAYHAHKGQLQFLREDVRVRLVRLAIILEGANIAIHVHLSRIGFGQKVNEEPVQVPEELIADLESANKELRRWRAEHSRSLPSRIYRRVRKLRR